ncbi:protein kinase, AMP-activated, alpha 2 catalytic subunit [Coelomomyces lativittatus]|nr:protein kinase, AMP-activated, alpha 2 catalytic subunit [Coelomomyces lativittatus]
MLVGKLPFDDDYIPVLFQKIMEGIYTIPSFLSEDAKHLITSMLKVNALERITISDIRRHPFFVKDLPAYLYPYLSFDAYGGESVIELVARQLECSTTHVLTQLCMNGDNPIKEAYSYYLDNPNVITSFLQSSQSSLSNSSSSFSSSLLGTVSYAPSMDTSLSKSFSSTSPSSSSSSSSSSSTSTTLPSHTCNFTATPPTPPFAPSLPAQPLPATHTEFTKSSNFSSADNAEPLLITPHLLALNSSGCLDSDSTAVSNLSNTSPFVSATSTTPSSVINSNSALSFFPSPPFPIPPTEKWHLGLRSQSSPHDIMCVIYQVLVEVGMEWKVIGPYHLSARPCVSPLSSTTFSTTTPSSHKNLPPSRHYPTIEIQLFKEDANWYFMDFKFIVAPFSPISRTSHIVCTGSSMPSISSSSNTSISSSTVPSSSPSSTPSHSTSNSNFSSNESLTMDTQKSHFCKVIHVFGFIKIVSILIQRLKHESPSSSSTSPFSLPTSSPPPPFPPINISMT